MALKKMSEYGFDTKNNAYVIAEIGINHGGDIDVARQLIDSAARAGVDAVKFQTYLTEQRAPKGNKAVFDILKKCELPLKAFKELKDHAGNRGVVFFSTPFDIESLNYLESINCPMYKVASFDVVNQKLLKAVAATGKPIIMSVGMASLEEIKDAYSIISSGNNKVALLHCISSYPLKEEDANLSTIIALRESFGCVVGYSDHTPDIVVPLYAVAAGAQVIEKHYKIDEAMECVDAPVSVTEEQTKKMISEIKRIEKIFGEGKIGLRRVEEGTAQFRRPSK